MGSSPIVSTARVQVRAFLFAPAAAHGARRAIRVPLPCHNGSVSAWSAAFLDLGHVRERSASRRVGAPARGRGSAARDDAGAARGRGHPGSPPGRESAPTRATRSTRSSVSATPAIRNRSTSSGSVERPPIPNSPRASDHSCFWSTRVCSSRPPIVARASRGVRRSPGCPSW